MFVPGEDENEPEEDWLPPPAITRELFLEWRAARRGTHPAQDLTNPVWVWLLDKNISAFLANDHFKGPDLIRTDSGPGWCFNRFGRTLTELSDGRKIIIGGEHEDSYDPDFFIYNDVVIVEKNGEIRILGYPEEHFPPTDFHSATRIGGEILLVGNLSYGENRRHGDTQVYLLDLRTMTFREVPTSGEKPGWISRHQAELVEAKLVIHGGMIDHGPDHGGYLKNFDSWSLDPADWKWTRLTHKKVFRWRFRREDGEAGELFKMRMAKYNDILSNARKSGMLPEIQDEMEQDFDRELLAKLYEPPVPHEVLLESPVDDALHFQIDGVSVNFEEGFGRGGVLMTVEGELPMPMLQDYLELVRQRLSTLDRCNYRVERSKA